MKEPAWIEHDGSAVCPVPAGHDVETKWDDGVVERDTVEGSLAKPDVWGSSPIHGMTITHYRDWTAFKQQEAMGKDVPEWAMRKALQLGEDYPNEGWINTFARYIAAHEQPPVDWLAGPVRASLAHLIDPLDGADLRDILAELRARIPNIDSLASAAGGGE